MNQTIESTKAYVCLFTCASTHAVHSELVPNLNVNSLLLAFRRFAIRRDLPSTLLSDNAKTFKSACKEVPILLAQEKSMTWHRVPGILLLSVFLGGESSGSRWCSLSKEVYVRLLVEAR